jgi:KDO2-lipid IV(A) lauroyltransferase
MEAQRAHKPAANFSPARARTEASLRRKNRARPMTALAGRTLLNVTSRIPLSGLHGIARTAARLGGVLPLRESRITQTNVDLCFPELSPAQRKRFVRDSLAEGSCMAAELGHLWLRPVEEVLALIVEVRGEEHIRAGIERGHGVLVASPHLGAWELLGLWFAKHFPLTSLFREPRVRELEAVYSAARGRSGASLFPADASGVRALYSALARGEFAGILPDQDPGRGAGEFVPFFGITTSTSTLVPRIAARSKAAMIFAFAERLPRGAGYCIHIRPGSPEIGGGDVEAGARALSRDVEDLVRIAPLQYMWSYKRFRTRPPGCASLYS